MHGKHERYFKRPDRVCEVCKKTFTPHSANQTICDCPDCKRINRNTKQRELLKKKREHADALKADKERFLEAKRLEKESERYAELVSQVKQLRGKVLRLEKLFEGFRKTFLTGVK